jgi:cytoplasmic iron level regulating protein YaaA (DUF328/UPF0246 family)
MLFVLSPAKTLDLETPIPAAVAAQASTPRFMAEAGTLVDLLRTQSPAQVAALMDLSEPLAALNVARYAAWRPRNTVRNSRPAVLTFDGDVYDGLQAKTLDGEALDWAQRHVAILSGLYGVLRPLDRLQPYRLEMGTTLANPAGRDLYAFWGAAPARTLDAQLRSAGGAKVVVNLASQEYFRAVDRRALKARVIDCVFEEGRQGGDWKIVSFFAKKARGTFARWAIDERLAHPDALVAFDRDGYAFAPAASAPGRLVFRRAASA